VGVSVRCHRKLQKYFGKDPIKEIKRFLGWLFDGFVNQFRILAKEPLLSYFVLMERLPFYKTRWEEEIRGLFDTSGLRLEIGPSYNPILSKRERFRVETIDHSHPTELKEEAFWKTPIFEFLRILSWVSSCWSFERANLLVATHREAGEPAAPQLE
jgi:hypothetical protein